mgnify:CR=1 FL=1
MRFDKASIGRGSFSRVSRLAIITCDFSMSLGPISMRNVNTLQLAWRVKLMPVKVVASPAVTHVKYRVVR